MTAATPRSRIYAPPHFRGVAFVMTDDFTHAEARRLAAVARRHHGAATVFFLPYDADPADARKAAIKELQPS